MRLQSCTVFAVLLVLAGTSVAAAPTSREDKVLIMGLQHELELDVRSGIPAPQVLRMATLTSAQVIGADRERGVIAAGKLADLILVEGDPSTRITDIHRITLVMKSGHIFYPTRIETALGIAPRN